MMNILEQSEALKGVPEQALMKEMQQPSGSMPQYLVLTELKRRKRMRDEYQRIQAQDIPTVAEEVVMGAGAPKEGIMQMSKAMAPKSSIAQNTGQQEAMPKQPTMGMAEGGIVRMAPGGGITGSTISNIAYFKTFYPNEYRKAVAEGTVEEMAAMVAPLAKDTDKTGLEEIETVSEARVPIFGPAYNYLFDEVPMKRKAKRKLKELEKTQPERALQARIDSKENLQKYDDDDPIFAEGTPVANLFGNYELPAADDSLTKGISLPESFSSEDFSLVSPSLSKTDRIDSLMQDPAGRKFDDYYQPYDVLGKLEQPTIDFDATYGPSPDLDEALTKAGTRPSILQSINMAGAGPTSATLKALDTEELLKDAPSIGPTDVGGLATPAGVDVDAINKAKSEDKAQAEKEALAKRREFLASEDSIGFADLLYDPTVENSEKFLLQAEKRDDVEQDINIRADNFLFGDQYTPPGEIYGTLLDGSVREMAKYQGASPEAITEISDRLYYEALADQIKKGKESFSKQDAQTQAEILAAIRKQNALGSGATPFFGEGNTVSTEGPQETPVGVPDLSELAASYASSSNLPSSFKLGSPSNVEGLSFGDLKNVKVDKDGNLIPSKKKKSVSTGGDKSVAGTSGSESKLKSRIEKLISDREKSAEQDKYLALAQAGLALMASDSPTIGGAIGEAGLVGVGAMKDAKSQYDSDILDLLTLQEGMRQADLTYQSALARASGSTDKQKRERIKLLQTQLNNVDRQLDNFRSMKQISSSYDDTGGEQKEYGMVDLTASQPELLARRDALDAEIQALTLDLIGRVPFDATGN